MKKTFLPFVLAAALFLVPVLSVAEEVTATVKGMVCSFCAQGIKKTFGKNEHVEKVDVDLDKKVVTLKVKEGHYLSDEVIRQGINDAGYEVLKLERRKDG